MYTDSRGDISSPSVSPRAGPRGSRGGLESDLVFQHFWRDGWHVEIQDL